MPTSISFKIESAIFRRIFILRAAVVSRIRKNPANQVTERDKANNQMLWVQKMNMYQVRVHEIIYEDLICA